MAVSRLFKQVVLGGLALAAIGGGFAAVSLLAADSSPLMKVEVYQVADLPVWKVAKDASPQYDGTLLVAYIRQVADMGPDDEGSIEEHASTASLVIRQTPAKHQKISDLLEKIREDQKQAEKREAARQAARKAEAASDERLRKAVREYEAAKAASEAARNAAASN